MLQSNLVHRFFGLYDSTFAIVNALCDVKLGSRASGQGDEVIVTGIGCDVFFPAFHFKGILPIFVDVNLDTLLPDLDVIETCIVEGKTKAVFIPSMFGNFPDRDRLRDICDEYEIFLVEILGSIDSMIGDISLVHSGNYFDVFVCCNPILDVSIGSFSKSIHKEKLQFNNKLSINWDDLYTSLLKHKKYFRFQNVNSINKLGGFSIIIKEASPFSRDELIKHLKDKGIDTYTIDSGSLLNQKEHKQIKHGTFLELVNSDVIMRDAFWIPLHQNKKVKYMVKTFDEFIESHMK